VSFDTLRHIEAMIGSSRPRVAPFQADKVVQRALLEIVRREAHPTLIQRLRFLLLAPVPRAALAVTIAGIGFAVGLVIGNPSNASTDNTNGSLMMTASADDVLF
jgi:anti-sigma factor RsiW